MASRAAASGLLRGKVVLVTGGARRVGRALALASARAGADVVVHFRNSAAEADEARREIEAMGRRAWTVQADFEQPEAIPLLIERAASVAPLDALVNSAAIFEQRTLQNTSLADWQRHIAVNLTAPFLLTQTFARKLGPGREGRVVNILDWRGLRPEVDHLAYSVSKAGLAALTGALALALAPNVTVNGLALGAILPPEGGARTGDVLAHVPARRWGDLAEVEDALLFLLGGPAYVTGEIIHLDGGRHLV